MIVRVVESKRTTAVTTSCVSTGLGFGEANLGILRVCEASNRTHLVASLIVVAPRTALVAAMIRPVTPAVPASGDR